ncbi:C-GCAxxG-C-C family (seleno)protein [Methanoregula sp.]|uniref:C-GCAxxG-C-C family (seleno)protein n=1 Tax=Methanoregula sp. TaxID=2052170 RepID=UPI00262D4022|nr:C-GCAxxG-C-C family (seleno)protein [Methanoregula sp.]MDD5142752.1 C-GCAxxG-C-C family (seleno)protein [Methanoregula sp.]
MQVPLRSADPAEVRKIAEEYYRSGQFYCSEAIVKSINDSFGLGYPESVIRLASGFPIGIGGSGCSCGAVTGGVMALGMVFGRDRAGDPRIDRCLGLCRELHALFVRQHGCLCCRTLTHGMVLKSPEHMQQCVAFTGEVAEAVAKIILRETAAGSE